MLLWRSLDFTALTRMLGSFTGKSQSPATPPKAQPQPASKPSNP